MGALHALIPALALALAGAARAESPAPDFDGIYRPGTSLARDWDCIHVGLEGGALAVRGSQMIEVGTWCELDQPTPVTDMPAMLYDGVCFDTGGRRVVRMLLMTGPEGTLWVLRDGRAERWQPCVAPP